MQTTTTDDATFSEHRALLFAIAYRMTGSVMDAEDIVQEAFLRWQRRAEAEVESPKAYLSAVVTRLSIDHLRAAHTQRETYIGAWLPEPLVTAPESDMAETAALHESLAMAFLVLLESLTPVERAVFLLHDVFVYDFREIAAIVGKGEANCRQLARRAREQIHAHRPRFDPEPEQRERLLQRFLAACIEGDLTALVDTLADDAILWSDGGGKAQATLRPIYGADRIARFAIGVTRKSLGSASVHHVTINGQPGAAFVADRRIVGVLNFDSTDDRISAVRIVVNPDKLRAAARALGVCGTAVMRPSAR